MTDQAKILFIGTGCSEGIPNLSCLFKDCKKYFNNNFYCGKLWWENVLHFFPKYNISNIDGLLITHEHNDALGGIDNLRDITRRMIKHPLPVYTTKTVQHYLKQFFPYIFTENISEIHGTLPELYISTIDIHKTIVIKDIQFEAFEVPHGSIPCLAYKIGSLCYISDCSELTKEMLTYINNSSILIIDCQYSSDEYHSTHISMHHLKDYLDNNFYVENPPSKIYLVGMCHKVDHELFSSYLKVNYPNVICAYDGLQILFPYIYCKNE